MLDSEENGPAAVTYQKDTFIAFIDKDAIENGRKHLSIAKVSIFMISNLITDQSLILFLD